MNSRSNACNRLDTTRDSLPDLDSTVVGGAGINGALADLDIVDGALADAPADVPAEAPAEEAPAEDKEK